MSSTQMAHKQIAHSCGQVKLYSHSCNNKKTHKTNNCMQDITESHLKKVEVENETTSRKAI